MRCKQKITYRTRDKAWASAFGYFKQYGFRNSAYKCWECGRFHLTTRQETDWPKKYKDQFNKWFGAEVL